MGQIKDIKPTALKTRHDKLQERIDAAKRLRQREKRIRLQEQGDKMHVHMKINRLYKMQELDERQRKAIILLSDPMHTYSNRYIAYACGVTRQSLYNWRNDPLFIQELDKEITKRKTSMRTEAYRHVYRWIRQGNKPMIKFYLKMTGDLKEHIVHEQADSHKSNTELDAEIKSLSSELGILIEPEFKGSRT